MKQDRLYTQTSADNYEDDATRNCILAVIKQLSTNKYSSASISAPESQQMPSYQSIFESVLGERLAKNLIKKREIELDGGKITFVNEKKMEKENKSDICLVTRAGINTAISLTKNYHCKMIILITRTDKESLYWKEYGAKLIKF